MKGARLLSIVTDTPLAGEAIAQLRELGFRARDHCLARMVDHRNRGRLGEGIERGCTCAAVRRRRHLS
jgi:hypothetical protein